MRAGADDYLVKPFSTRELLARVQSRLELARVRAEAAQELSRRSAQFKTLLDRAPLGVYLVDDDFRISEINPIALPSFGDIAGGVIGRDFDEIVHLLWERDYADEIVRIFRHTLRTGDSYVTPEHAGLRLDRGITESTNGGSTASRCRRGAMAWCATSATPPPRLRLAWRSSRAVRRCARPTAARTSSWRSCRTSCAVHSPRSATC